MDVGRPLLTGVRHALSSTFKYVPSFLLSGDSFFLHTQALPALSKRTSVLQRSNHVKQSDRTPTPTPTTTTPNNQPWAAHAANQPVEYGTPCSEPTSGAWSTGPYGGCPVRIPMTITLGGGETRSP